MEPFDTMEGVNATVEDFNMQLMLMAEKLFDNDDSTESNLFDLNPQQTFGRNRDDFKRLSRNKRMSCPGGVGNFGFNSFNFMTFVLLTLNAVANTNNNINNNNNNNIDINYNTINQDSNNVVSNSENMNMVTATILPVPGRRSLDLLNK